VAEPQGSNRPQSPKKIEAEGPKREDGKKKKGKKGKDNEKSKKRGKNRDENLRFIFPSC
jgi:hypothetical protein